MKREKNNMDTHFEDKEEVSPAKHYYGVCYSSSLN